MTSLEQGMYLHLSSVLSVGEAITPMALPERAVLPHLTHRRVSAVPLHTHSGANRLVQARIQWDCWAGSYREAVALAEELQAAVDGFSGWWGEVRIGSVLLGAQVDDHDPERGLYRRIVDGMVRYVNEGTVAPEDGS